MDIGIHRHGGQESRLDSRNSRNSRICELISRSIEIDELDAKSAGELGFMSRALAQTTLPHSRVDSSEFERTNGLFTLSIHAPRRVGLPYGMIPRILLTWISSEAVRTHSPELFLGNSMKDFMDKLGLGSRGGVRGDITRLKQQSQSLFSSTITLIQENNQATHSGFKVENILVARSATLFWNNKKPEEPSLFQSHLSLTDDFFRLVVDKPIPIDLRVLRTLRHSSLAMDIYVWLVYRIYILRNPMTIPWVLLKNQFGANYNSSRGLLDFKGEFSRRLKEVLIFYPQARVEPKQAGLFLEPSPPHIPPTVHKAVHNQSYQR